MDVEGASVNVHPRSNGARAPLRNLSTASADSRKARSVAVPADIAEVPADPDEGFCKPQPPPTAAELNERAIRMFVDRRSGVSGSGDDALTVEATYELVLHAQQAIHQVWEQHRAHLCGSPARPDLPMDKEEGLGYILGDVLRGELLPGEARYQVELSPVSRTVPAKLLQGIRCELGVNT